MGSYKIGKTICWIQPLTWIQFNDDNVVFFEPRREITQTIVINLQWGTFVFLFIPDNTSYTSTIVFIIRYLAIFCQCQIGMVWSKVPEYKSEIGNLVKPIQTRQIQGAQYDLTIIFLIFWIASKSKFFWNQKGQEVMCST